MFNRLDGKYIHTLHAENTSEKLFQANDSYSADDYANDGQCLNTFARFVAHQQTATQIVPQT